jgi:hypothetical protein
MKTKKSGKAMNFDVGKGTYIDYVPKKEQCLSDCRVLEYKESKTHKACSTLWQRWNPLGGPSSTKVAKKYTGGDDPDVFKLCCKPQTCDRVEKPPTAAPTEAPTGSPTAAMVIQAEDEDHSGGQVRTRRRRRRGGSSIGTETSAIRRRSRRRRRRRQSSSARSHKCLCCRQDDGKNKCTLAGYTSKESKCKNTCPRKYPGTVYKYGSTKKERGDSEESSKEHQKRHEESLHGVRHLFHEEDY